ncbi:MAG: hypothetical protein ACREDR_42090, partial [Blastocatellia bacterium]
MIIKARAEAGKVANRPFTEAEVHALVATEAAIVQARRSHLKGITDKDILDAIENARKNLQTADTGLIYEHHAASPVVRELSRYIRDGIEEFNEEALSSQKVTTVDELNAFERLAEIVQIHIERGEDEQSYLRSISVRVPWDDG